MKLKFFNPSLVERNIKATVHRTGKIGFTSEAAKKFELSKEKSIALAVNEEDSSDMNLYGILYPEIKEEAFKINQAGDYFFVNAKPLLESFGLDYINKNIAFDISEENISGVTMLKFKYREIQRKKKGTEEE